MKRVNQRNSGKMMNVFYKLLNVKLLCEKLLIGVLLIVVMVPVEAQTTVVFTGKDNHGGFLPLHHVVAENLSQGWTDTLYYPDTIMMLTNVGIPEHHEGERFSLSQNTPNPFNGVTDFTLTLPSPEQVFIEVVDLVGRKVTALAQRLDAGSHAFRVWLNTPQQYILTVRTSRDVATIKMLNNGGVGAERIAYIGALEWRKHGTRNDLPYTIGDMMRSTGYYLLENGQYLASEVVEQALDGSCTVDLVFDLFATVINDGHYVNVGTFFIPDGIECNGNCVCEIPLNVNSYDVGRTIQSVSDIQYVRLKMEHSYLGDLWIQLECPNGQSATLLNKYGTGSSGCSSQIPSADWGWDQEGSPNAYLGLYYEPDGFDKCDPAENPMGTCWNYCWTDDNTHGQTFSCGMGYIYEACNRITANNPNDHLGSGTGMRYVDTSDVANRLNFFHPAHSFSNLIGCPMNGVWHIRIIDGYSGDNGYVEEAELVLVEDTLVVSFEIPTVMTGNGSNITYGEAVCEGVVIADGLSPVTARGICWSTSPNPTLSDSHTDEGPGVGPFTSTLTDLTPGVLYSYRAYATNAMGTGYGDVAQLTAMPNTVPVVTTLPVSDNAGYTVTCGGVVTDDGGLPILEQGLCWSTSSNPTIVGNHCVDYSGLDTFSCQVTGLTPGTNYYIRAYATNAIGTSYGNNVSIQTAYLLNSHVLSLSDITNVSVVATARLMNFNTSNTAKGFCWSTSPDPTMADNYLLNTQYLGSSIDFTSTITGLDPGTTYYVRSFATNNVGTQYSSNQKVFTTLALPLVETDSVLILADSVVMTGANILHNGYLPIIGAGVCWSTTPNPTDTNDHFAVTDTIGNSLVTLSWLSPDSIYYLRAYATNSAGTSYGQEYVFRPKVSYGQPCPGAETVTDYDGNVYNTVLLGTQCWMGANLRTTHFADGTAIALGSQEANFTSYRYYPNNDSSLVDVYGYMYNWHAAMHGAGATNASPSGIQGACPDGWHLPSRPEWVTLRLYLGNQSQYRCADYTASIAKSLASTTGWKSYSANCAVGNIQAANNETGFNAYPAGGEYMHFGQSAAFWTTSSTYSTAYGGYAYLFELTYSSAELSDWSQNQWFQWHSVRCVKN